MVGPCARGQRVLVAGIFVFGVAVASSCRLGELVIPRADPMIVVQAVLNTADSDQLVLVEHTLSGDTTLIDQGHYDPTNPIATDEGEPVSGATVTITDPNGVVLTGIEDLTSKKVGTGVYRVSLARARVALIPGGVYRLRVATLTGEVVTGRTRIPNQTVGPTLPAQSFNRGHDTLQISWPKTPQARAYTVLVQSPYEELYSFVDSATVQLPGMMRNVEDINLRALFFPGFIQPVTVAAIDTNLYDFYRTANDPFTGLGLINHLDGGIGVFGSMVILSTRTLDVTADHQSTIEGTYVLASAAAAPATKASQLTLYVESSDSSALAISGSYIRPASDNARDAFIGTSIGSSIVMQLLLENSVAHTTETFHGTIRNDSIIGNYESGGGQVIFVRVH